MAITTPAAWKDAANKHHRKTAMELALPSGAVVLARRPGLETWMLRGRIPEALSAMILASIERDTPRVPTSEERQELVAFNRAIVVATVVEPRVVEGVAGEGEISYDDIPDDDVTFLLEWGRRAPEVAAAAPFRDGDKPPAGSVDGANVRPSAEQTAGDRGPGAGA